MIAILDFGSAGNVRSVANAFARIGTEATLMRTYDAVADAGKFSGLVIPGVGSFAVVPKIQAALGGKEGMAGVRMPVLCICLGMQAMMNGSEEAPEVKGLGIVAGDVRKLQGKVRLPQLGWNRVWQAKSDELFKGIASGEYFYFANSYAPFPEGREATIATTEYGEKFASAVRKENWLGVQFHPEKSGKAGEQLLRNFAKICEQQVR